MQPNKSNELELPYNYSGYIRYRISNIRIIYCAVNKYIRINDSAINAVIDQPIELINSFYY